MIRRPPRSTLSSSSAASDVYKRQPCFPLSADVCTFSQFLLISFLSISYLLFQSVTLKSLTSFDFVTQLTIFHFCFWAVSYTHLRAHETPEHLVCRLLLEKKKQ